MLPVINSFNLGAEDSVGMLVNCVLYGGGDHLPPAG